METTLSTIAMGGTFLIVLRLLWLFRAVQPIVASIREAMRDGRITEDELRAILRTAFRTAANKYRDTHGV